MTDVDDLKRELAAGRAPVVRDMGNHLAANTRRTLTPPMRPPSTLILLDKSRFSGITVGTDRDPAQKSGFGRSINNIRLFPTGSPLDAFSQPALVLVVADRAKEQRESVALRGARLRLMSEIPRHVI